MLPSRYRAATTPWRLLLSLFLWLFLLRFFFLFFLFLLRFCLRFFLLWFFFLLFLLLFFFEFTLRLFLALFLLRFLLALRLLLVFVALLALLRFLLALFLLALLLTDAQRALMERIGEVGEAPVGGGGQGFASGVQQLAAHLLVQLGDSRNVTEFLQAGRHQLLRIEPKSATCQIGCQPEGETGFLRTSEHIAGCDRGGKADLGRVVHEAFPFGKGR
ncbi:hypothetical protein AQJ27_48760 [Streptomyces olivochromogenes]|nr:hypothetical protein AQJ27_48760 [Streptomyces olivochromogenes]